MKERIRVNVTTDDYNIEHALAFKYLNGKQHIKGNESLYCAGK